MTIALWCVLAAGLMPYIFVGIGKSNGLDNDSPRVANLATLRSLSWLLGLACIITLFATA